MRSSNFKIDGVSFKIRLHVSTESIKKLSAVRADFREKNEKHEKICIFGVGQVSDESRNSERGEWFAPHPILPLEDECSKFIFFRKFLKITQILEEESASHPTLILLEENVKMRCFKLGSKLEANNSLHSRKSEICALI